MTDIARKVSRFNLLVLLSIFLACTQSPDSRRLETVSMLGAELYSDNGGDSLLMGIETRLSAEPNNLSTLMEKGSVLEGLRRYREAVEVYTQCLLLSPESPEILRRRGQRYITLRKLDSATADLELTARRHTFVKAENLKYTENLNWAIWYYLALTYYLKADFEKALTAFQKSQNDRSYLSEHFPHVGESWISMKIIFVLLKLKKGVLGLRKPFKIIFF